jgi:3-oxoacyl-(acyl-carrier-protein) synthase
LSPTTRRFPHQVAITAIGAVSAFGVGIEPLASALERSAPAELGVIDGREDYHRRGAGRRGLLAVTPVGSAFLAAGEARRMSPPSRFAVAAAREAVASAALPSAALAGAAIALSTAFGPSSFSEGLLRQVLLEEPDAASPFLFTESVANAPAAQVAIATGTRGPNITVCQREAGALIALGRGAAAVAAGRVGSALVGAVEELSPLLYALLDRFRALARSHHGLVESARPFDRRRDGFIPAEGATVLVLEAADAARARAPHRWPSCATGGRPSTPARRRMVGEQTAKSSVSLWPEVSRERR